MKGKVLSFSVEKDAGLIIGEDGNRYTFFFNEWQQKETPPRQGQSVVFVKASNFAFTVSLAETPRAQTSDATPCGDALCVPPCTKGNHEKIGLFRDKQKAKLGGVCSGLALRFHCPVFVWRCGFVAFAFLGLLGVVVYLIMWIICPTCQTREHDGLCVVHQPIKWVTIAVLTFLCWVPMILMITSSMCKVEIENSRGRDTPVNGVVHAKTNFNPVPVARMDGPEGIENVYQYRNFKKSHVALPDFSIGISGHPVLGEGYGCGDGVMEVLQIVPYGVLVMSYFRPTMEGSPETKALYILTKKQYVDGDDLKRGIYVYVGRTSYQTVGGVQKTVHVFQDSADFPSDDNKDEIPLESKR